MVPEITVTARHLALVVLLFAVAPHEAAAMEKIGRARVTYYWLVDESDSAYRPSSEVAIQDVRGRVIARTSRKFRKHLLLEGSGKLRDGRVINYQRHVRGDARFRVTRHEYGAAYGKCSLEPYRTIAVDPKYVKLGTRVYIPQFDGTKLPDGTVHDGIFMAHDRSASVRGAHIDIFTKAGSRSARPFTARGYPTGARVTLYRVAGPDPKGCHTKR